MFDPSLEGCILELPNASLRCVRDGSPGQRAGDQAARCIVFSHRDFGIVMAQPGGHAPGIRQGVG
jgi:hypothetical protein